MRGGNHFPYSLYQVPVHVLKSEHIIISFLGAVHTRPARISRGRGFETAAGTNLFQNTHLTMVISCCIGFGGAWVINSKLWVLARRAHKKLGTYHNPISLTRPQKGTTHQGRYEGVRPSTPCLMGLGCLNGGSLVRI